MHIDFKALAILLMGSVAFFFLWKWKSLFAEPSIYFSHVKSLNQRKGRTIWSGLPQYLLYPALVALSLAFLDPHLFVNRKEGEVHDLPPKEGIAIYLVLDQSGSMEQQVLVESKSGLHMVSKIDLLKDVSRQFIVGDPELNLEGRPNDMIGLIFFARAARVKVPLTLDHSAVLRELSAFKPIGDKDQDGTSIGYAIFKTANLIASTRHYAQELISKGEPAYKIKNSIIILITDGLQDPNPLDKGKRLRNMDVPEAAEYAKQQDVRLYIINVEPNLRSEDFAPYRNIMTRAAELTGGKFYMVDSGKNLEQIYQEIDQLEKSVLPVPKNVQKDLRPDLFRRLSFYPYFIAFGLMCLFASILLETTLLRRVP